MLRGMAGPLGVVAPRAAPGRCRGAVRRRRDGELHALDVGREHHHGLRARHAVERADLADQPLSEEVFAVFTLSSTVYSPVTWWHSSTPSSRPTCSSNSPMRLGWPTMTPMKAVM